VLPLGSLRQLSQNANSSSASVSVDCYTATWFPKIIWLYYIISLVVAMDFLYVFPYTDAGHDLVAWIRRLAVVYSVWFMINFSIVWLLTLLCADVDLQNFWSSSALGKWLSNEPLCSIGWIFLLTALVSISASWLPYIDIADTGIGSCGHNILAVSGRRYELLWKTPSHTHFSIPSCGWERARGSSVAAAWAECRRRRKWSIWKRRRCTMQLSVGTRQ
jgi:hypothetical protein